MKIFSGVETVIVIEIGNDWLKIVEGKVSSKGVIINDGCFLKLSEIKNPVLDTITSIFKDKKWDKQNIIAYLPRHLVTLRILELPSINPKEIDNIVNLHIGQQTPYSREEIVYSYKIVPSEKKGYARVVLVIARRNLIDERMDIMIKASVNPKKMGLGSEGVLHWFNAFYSNNLKLPDSQAIALIDIDSNYSDFIVVHKGGLRFSKNILIGANHLIEEKDVYLKKFIDEVGHSLKVFREESNNIEVAKMFLSGAAINIEDLDKLISAQFNLPCETLSTGAFKNAPKFISLSPALGLLTKYKGLEFDLMPHEKRIGQMMEEKRKNLTMTGILFSAIILALSILMAVHINNKNMYIKELKQKIASIKNASDEVDKMRLSIDLFHERLDASGDVLNLLNEVYKTIPKEVYLTSVDVENKGQIDLKGHAVAISDVFKFVTALSTSPFLEKVKNTYATIKEENNNEYADFEITAEYKGSKGR
jgi:Tfp pilus assembly PilM family ATPase/Tfp pilus assembly protein PilN